MASNMGTKDNVDDEKPVEDGKWVLTSRTPCQPKIIKAEGMIPDSV